MTRHIVSALAVLTAVVASGSLGQTDAVAPTPDAPQAAKPQISKDAALGAARRAAVARGMNLDEYDVEVEEFGARYFVTFSLRGRNVAGGMVGFWVDGVSGEILKTYLYQ